MTEPRFTNGVQRTNGQHRDTRGRFRKGNPGGPGSPVGSKAAKLRAALVKAVSEEDIKAIVEGLVREAKGGDVQAARELLNRAIGKPIPADLIERLEALEQALEARR